MIGLMIGAPGAGKSYEFVVFHALPALRKGYKVITNLPLHVEAFGAIDPSFPDLIELRTTAQLVRGSFDADPQSRGQTDMFVIEGDPSSWKPHKGRVFSNVWDYYTEWKHPETGNGPLFIIDEAHLALPRMGTDKDVAEFFSKHRHFNINIQLGTQSAPKLDSDIKDMVQNVYRLRKAIALGKSDQYIRRVLDGVRGSVIEETTRTYQPQYFKLYRSHTQGSSVAEEAPEDVTPFIVKFKRATWGVLGVGLVASVLGIGSWVSDMGKAQNKAVAAVKRPQVPPKPVAYGLPAWAREAGVVAVPAAAAASAQQAVTEQGPPEPFATKGVHVVGHFAGASMSRYFVAISQNALVVATYSDADLAAMGYKFRALTDCAAVLEWNGKQRTVTCDSPQQGISVGGSPTGNTQGGASVARAAGHGDAVPASGPKPAVAQPPTALSDADLDLVRQYGGRRGATRS